MPLISRLRLVNVRYDHATKMFTDDLFDLAGENSLFNLMNGGGKTVLLQLILQAVLPRTDLGRERKFDSLFEGQPARSSHILVEWLLDSAERKYLLTGLCATRTQDQDDGCKWFAYAREYKEDDSLRIDTIRLVDDARRPVSFPELRRLLKSRSDSRLRLFESDEKSAYGRYLEEFGIFPAEWEAIKRINLTEGGIEEFFKQCRTSRECLETLLIPNIEDVLTNDEAMNRRRLSESFALHFNVLKRIPEWTRTLREMEEFRRFADGYIAVVDDHAGTREEIGRRLAGLDRLRQRTTEREKAEELERKSITERLDRNAADSLELEYQRESFELYRKNLSITSLKFEEERLNALVNADREELDRTGRFLRISEAADIVRQLDHSRAAIGAARHELDEIDAGAGQNDHLQQLYRCEYTLSEMYRAETASHQATLESSRTQMAESERQRTSGEKERSSLQGRHSELVRTLGEFVGERKSLESEQKSLLEPFSLEDRLEPATALRRVETEDAALAERQRQLEIDLKRLDEEQPAMEAEEKRLHGEEKILSDKGADLRQKRAVFEEHRTTMQTHLRLFRVDSRAADPARNPAGRSTDAGISTDPWAPETAARIEHLLLERTQARRHAQIEALSLREQGALLRDRDWFPINGDIERLRDALRNHGVKVLSGGEYLAGLEDEESRRRALAGSPLLPYGLVVNVADLTNPALLPLPDVPIRAGVPLIFREHLQESVPTNAGELSNIHEGAAILEHTDRELFILPERRAVYAADLERRFAIANEDAASLEHAVDDLLELRRKLHEFTAAYLPDSERSMTAAEKAYASQLRNLEKQQAGLNDNRVAWRNRVASLAESGKVIESQRLTLSDHKRRLSRCLELAGRIEECSGKARNTELERNDVEASIRRTDALIASASVEIDRLKHIARERGDAINVLQTKRGAIRIPEPWTERWPETLSIPELEAIQTRLKDTLAGFDRKREDVLSRISQQEGITQTLLKQLERTEIPETEARSASPADTLQLSAWKEQIKTRTKEMAQRNKTLAKTKSQIDQLQGAFNEARLSFENRYTRPPLALFSADFDMVDSEMKLRRQAIDAKHDELTNRLSIVNDHLSLLHEARVQIEAFLNNQPQPYGFGKEPELITTGGITEDDIPAPDLPAHLKLQFEACRKALREGEEKREALEKQRQILQKTFSNSTVLALKNFFTTMEAVRDPFEPETVRGVFGKCFTIIETLHQDMELQCMNAKKDQAELTRTCATYVSRLLEELRQIDSRSKIDIGGKSVRMVEIQIDEADAERRENRMLEYVDRLVKELGSTEFEPKQLRIEIEKRVHPARLLDAACDLGKARIRVRKPAHPPGKPRMAAWEELPSFSGGEKYICYFALYISLLTYIRVKKTGSGRSTKVLLADNPFGRMSADFMLDGMFTLARHTDTQMICFTALKESAILQHFPRLFSMVLRRNLDGREVMTTEQKILSLETARLAPFRQPVLF
ncbi:MAG TPA: hypothetical protein PLP29_10435 [Candidatus Ozemobacteraceae bacterium]|nr:hypothetical protein [Candidatus Ozemobacteraceae bacterium]